ncbi:hypothetical protein VTN77DRAFT_5054 [Rasamsonia byssochlamydoides]|uniref:uncharacterized protein n=1 Tax=Rasamsonia byssochlamydoides TaxID=89139 RepID=UPI0037443561
MSNNRNDVTRQSLASSSDSHQSSSAVHGEHRGRADGTPRDVQMDDSNAVGGELEGSTLGSSSRDEEKRSHRQRRAQRSGGFLLDSAFAPSTRLLGSIHRPHLSSLTSSTGKRRPSEAEIAVPQKRSSHRRPWHQQRPSLGSSPLATAVTNAPPADGVAQSAAESAGPENTNTTSRAASGVSITPRVGLDTDPVQIVNLALNLSESRRRNYAGRVTSSPLPGGRRSTVSSSQAPFMPVDNHVQRPAASVGQASSQAHRHSSYTTVEDRLQRNLPPQEPVTERLALPGVVPGNSDRDWQVPYEFSDATLARAEKARQHIELFWEYLRLLSHLPPLRSSSQDSASTADDSSSGRAYNPLQCIRNRKVRFREKYHIDIESEGWQDVAKVHEWVNAVEDVHYESRDPDHCLKLPPFQYPHEERRGENEKADDMAVSPSSSARRSNVTGNVKPQRPRFDWVITPAELLADAAWLEDGLNKTKIVDKDGNKLYPDPTKLKHVGGKAPNINPPAADVTTSTREKHASTEEGLPSPVLPTFEHTRPDRSSDRGRRRHKLRSALHIPRSPSSSGRGKNHKRSASRRSSSSSSDSSSDDEMSRGRTRQSNWEKRLNSKLEAAIHARKISSLGKPRSESPEKDRPEDDGEYAHASAENRDDSGKREAETNKVVSSAASIIEKDETCMSLDMDSTAPNSPAHGPLFPSITANLSPPSSRSPSPRRKPFPRVFHERSKSKRHNQLDQGNADEGFLEADSAHGDSDRIKFLGPSPLPEQPLSTDEPSVGDLRRQKSSAQQESKLRGLFKGGRLAEIVGSEVSRVGDFIWRKDGGGHSRRSSYASSIASDYRESDDEKTDGETKAGKRTSLRRLTTSSNGELETEKEPLKPFMPHLPSFAPSFRYDDRDHLSPTSLDVRVRSPRNAGSVQFSRMNQTEESPSSLELLDSSTSYDRRSSYGFGSALKALLEQNRAKKIGILEPLGKDRPPVTCLANADASPRNKRPALSEATRTWSISGRSMTTLNDPNLTEKREIQRFRALLLSSGIKAREICRRAEESPPKFLVQDLHTAIPNVSRLEEFDCAARSLVQRFENSKESLHQSMQRFSKSDFAPLRSQLENLETLVNQSLTPRVRAAAVDAENLSTHLNTTSTLEVKQLSDALDKGIRKRNRRLRWVRRVGFVLLEWTVVGVMWWLWLVVMVFKIIRGIGKGVISGIRWVLWL